LEEYQSGGEGQGVAAPTRQLELDVDLPITPALRDKGAGSYYWTVVVVRLGADGAVNIVGEWGEKREFIYSESSPTKPPKESPTRVPTPTRFPITPMWRGF
jgi:hypothetical protein